MPTDMRAYMQARRSKRRQDLLEISGNKCVKCGTASNLQFDHRNRLDKCFTLSGAGLDKAWKTILQEHAKCDLLCEACHKLKTKLAGDLSKEPVNKNKTPFVHGSPRT